MVNLENKVINISLHLNKMREKYNERSKECYEKSHNKRESSYNRKDAHNYMWLYQGKIDMIDDLLTNLQSDLYNQQTESFLLNFLNK